MKQFFLALLCCLAFSISWLHGGLQPRLKKQAIIEHAAQATAERFRHAIIAGDAQTVRELLEADLIKGDISLSELHPAPELQCILYKVGVHGRYHTIAALHLAAAFGHIEVARVLIEHNASIDIADSNGMTPLMWAAQEGQLAMIRFLIEAGANDTITENAGWDIFEIAENSEREAPSKPKARAIQEVLLYFIRRGFSHPYLLNKGYVLAHPDAVARIIARGGLITWPQNEDYQEHYSFQVNSYEASPLAYAKHKNLPCYNLLLQAQICDNLTREAKRAYRRIFAALCAFNRLKKTLNLPIVRDVQRYILLRTVLQEDVLKSTAFVERRFRRDYNHIMAAIQRRSSSLGFAPTDILSFFTLLSHS